MEMLISKNEELAFVKMALIPNGIYQAVQRDERYIPVKETVVASFSNERSCIRFLELTGGGIYRNVLHNFSVTVKPDVN